MDVMLSISDSQVFVAVTMSPIAIALWRANSLRLIVRLVNNSATSEVKRFFACSTLDVLDADIEWLLCEIRIFRLLYIASSFFSSLVSW